MQEFDGIISLQFKEKQSKILVNKEQSTSKLQLEVFYFMNITNSKNFSCDEVILCIDQFIQNYNVRDVS